VSVPKCTRCRARLAPAEGARCLGCGTSAAATAADRAVAALESAAAPLPHWDLKRLLDRDGGPDMPTGTLLVALSRDLRICWAGRGTYGLYRHGLLPNVRGLGPAGEAHLLAAPRPLSLDQLHFVLQHQGYRYQLASLSNALHRQTGRREGPPPALSEAERVRREQRFAGLLQISRRSPLFEEYLVDTRRRVRAALRERARRLAG
jgi:hypothetical protein